MARFEVTTKALLSAGDVTRRGLSRPLSPVVAGNPIKMTLAEEG